MGGENGWERGDEFKSKYFAYFCIPPEFWDMRENAG